MYKRRGRSSPSASAPTTTTSAAVMSSEEVGAMDSAATPLLAEESRGDESAEAASASPVSATSSVRPRSWISLMLSPLMDETGDAAAVGTGLSTLFVFGGTLGVFVMPHDSHLHPSWYRIISAGIGYIYFVAWSVSFYPQVLTNFRRKTTHGLSVDFCLLNVLGFCCYTTYTIALYASPTMRQEYRARQHSDGIPVESNDVAFCVHALALSLVTVGQIVWYNGGFSALSQLRPEIQRFVLVLLVWIFLLGPSLVLLGIWHGLDYLYSLSAIKVLISLVKYLPQVILNIQRQSTVGWSIWQILLDLTGGLLSDVQLVGDTWATLPSRTPEKVATAVLTGNPAKLALGTLSMAFDVVFIFQHYILYPSTSAPTEERVFHDDDDEEEASDEDGASSVQALNGACPADRVPREEP